MSSFVFMKVLESAPQRYDRGLRILSRGRIERVYEAIADGVAAPGQRVLDVGCGTGGVALACLRRGALVTGIDRNPAMLEVARAKAARLPGAEGLEWLELGAAEIEDRFPEASFDAVTACLVFSELGAGEQDYVLKTIRSRLKPGGRLVLADEVLAATGWGRLRQRLARAPFALAAYLLAQTTTRPVADLEARVRAAGFRELATSRPWSDGFAILRARVGGEGP